MSRHAEGAQATPASRPARLGRAGAAAVGKTSYLPMDRADVERFLEGMVRRLDDALGAEPFVAEAGRRLGADLAEVGLVTPEALGRTVEVLVANHPVPPDRLPRLASLLGELTTGFARAQRDRTLAEQERIRRSALAAQQHAEQALRASEARFRRLAAHDPLTELPNRAMFSHRLAKAAAETTGDRHVGLCLIDLNGFKVVNDRLGHLAGDELLAQVGRRLAPRAAGHGYLLARLGGTEFGALIDSCAGAEDLVTTAEEILGALAEPFEVDGHRLSVTGTIGIAALPAGADPADLMRAADAALHWAKAEGKGRWTLYDPERRRRDAARYALRADLPAAMQHGEFELEYQPLVALADGRVVGAEALARWRHPRFGLLPPDQFIGLAEESGLIVPLGGQLLLDACREAAGWGEAGPYVSVNVAAHQIRQPDLIDRVQRALDTTGLSPHRLQLEITESGLVPTDAATRTALNTLASLGVRLVIDDFGTGYANLSYLRDLPVHGLKLAAMFVAGLAAEQVDHGDQAILTALLSLAHALRLTVTAEGVEGPLQASRLADLGCDIGQGWYLGRPRPAGGLLGSAPAGPPRDR